MSIDLQDHMTKAMKAAGLPSTKVADNSGVGIGTNLFSGSFNNRMNNPITLGSQKVDTKGGVKRLNNSAVNNNSIGVIK